MYTAIFSIFSGASFFYLGYNYPQIKKRLQTPVKQLKVPPNHNFFPQTVNQYTELLEKKEEKKYVIYSRYHKCPLSTHQLINQQTIDQQLKRSQKQQPQIIEKSISNLQSLIKDPPQSQQKTQEKIEINQKKHKALFERLYKEYAHQLVHNKTCNSVQLIYGPIFSKDTTYKIDKEVVKNVYVSNVKVSKDGEWLTDRFYTVIICNRNQGSYVNGFSHRKSNYPNFRFLNYLTSLKKLEEQTGLIFNVSGQQLTRIDYQGISKQRVFESQQYPKESPKQQQQNE